MRERLFLPKYNGTEREGGSSIDQPKVRETAQALSLSSSHFTYVISCQHHTRLNRIARASSWPGANVILAGYSSSKSALMLDANHAEISPAVHSTSFWFSIPRWNHYVLNGVAYAEASLHAFESPEEDRKDFLLVQANLSFCHASPHLFCRLNCWRPGAANLLILLFFLHPQRWRNFLEWYHHIERRSHHFSTGE